MAAVLKKDYSLVGRDSVPVLRALRRFKGELPADLARLKRDHPLDTYKEEELVSHLEGILGVDASEVLEMAGVEGADTPASVSKATLLFAVHTAIIEANAKGQPRGTTLGGKRPGSPGAGSSTGEGGEEDRKKVSIDPLFMSLL